MGSKASIQLQDEEIDEIQRETGCLSEASPEVWKYIHSLESEQILLPVKELIGKLSTLDIVYGTKASLTMKQYDIAIAKNDWTWIEELRQEAVIMFDLEWIDENILSEDDYMAKIQSSFRNSNFAAFSHSPNKRSAPEQEPSASVPKRKKSKCPASGCEFSSRHIKNHVYRVHFPLLFHGNEASELREGYLLHVGRYNGLRWISKVITDSESLKDLLAYVNDTPKPQIIPNGKVEISNERQEAMRCFLRKKSFKIPDKFLLKPKLNSVACLLHWRILLFLIEELSHSEQTSWFELCNKEYLKAERHVKLENERKAASESLQAPVPPPTVQPFQFVLQTIPIHNDTDLKDIYPSEDGFDSHFYLDRLCRGLWPKKKHQTIYDVLDRVDTTSTNVNLVGGLAVFCDPEFYGDMVLPIDPKWRIAVGIHYDHADLLGNADWAQFWKLINDPCVVALGDIGFDQTNTFEHRKKQIRILNHILKNWSCKGLHKRQVLMMRLKCRDTRENAFIVHNYCLNLVKKYCSREQLIHLVGFDADVRVFTAWRTHYPNCYFGLNGTVKSFKPYQIAAVKMIPRNRLLIESNAPYMSPSPSGGINTPAYLGDVAQIVASARGGQRQEILAITAWNGAKLYSLPTI